MSQFSIPIDDNDRCRITIPPPPMYGADGSEIPYPIPVVGSYEDLRIMKRSTVLYIDEELDIYDHPHTRTHFRMMIRNLPYQADLNVILRAANHMMLISNYSKSYERRVGVDAKFESGYWDVKYELAAESFHADHDTMREYEVPVTHDMRRRIWIELFNAMGYPTVKFGHAVLNVRKR